MQSTFVGDFKINKMTKQQYSGIVPSQTEVYITTDEADAVLSVNGVLPNAQGNVTLNIPSAVTESTVAGWGFTKNEGTVTSVNNVQPVNGNVTLTASDVGAISGITSTDVTTALGYTPVNKAGDTMSGDLTVGKSEPALFIKNTDITQGTTPATAQYNRVWFYDTSDNTLASIYTRYYTDGDLSIRLSCKNQNNTDTAFMSMGYDSNGKKYFNFPNSTCVDGQWVQSNGTVISASSGQATGTYSFSLSSYLPNDNYSYEVILNVVAKTASDYNGIVFKSDYIAPAYTTASYSQFICTTTTTAGNLIMPIGSNRNLDYVIGSNGTDYLYIRLYAYRRIGTNG